MRPAARKLAALAVAASGLGGAFVLRGHATPAAGTAGAPRRLADTGLYADLEAGEIAPGVLPYSPQYPLWTDGAAKRRWIRLPEGTAIDASDPDAWVFPVGTRFWKEFSFGRRVETRYMEREADGSWLYATYLWSEDGRSAELAPPSGVRGACESVPGLRHDVPSLTDCQACHDAGRSQVLGFGSLQLSPDRDPLAPHADAPREGDVDLPGLARRGLLRGLPERLLAQPPRVPAATARERAVLGYLHGNCGGCHNARGPLASLGLELDVPVASGEGATVPAVASAVGRPSRFRIEEGVDSLRIAPGDPQASVLFRRLASRNPLLQMPALGTHAVDGEAAALVGAWIREDLGASRPALAPRPDVCVSSIDRSR